MSGIAATVAAVRAGALDPVELARLHLARIARGNGALHAMVAVDEDGVLRDAAALRARLARGALVGPLAGVVVAVKGVFDLAGLPTRANARLFDGAAPAAADSAVAARLRAAGALLVGHATCWEMSVGGPSRDSPAPPAVNPWGPGVDPGGSSSGSAVAVAAGMAMAAIGGDTGGSIRLPASFCGLAGFKPGHGVVPMAGSVGFAESLDVAGPIAASAADCAVVQAVLAGVAPHGAVALEGLRVGVPVALLRHGAPGAAMTARFEAACAAMVRGGAVVREVALPSAALFNQCYFLIARGEAFARWGAALAAGPERFNALTRRSLAIGALIPPAALVAAAKVRGMLREELAAAMAGVDVLALPTTPEEAGGMEDGDGFSRPDAAPFTRPFSLAGVPAVSVPCGRGARGRPLGLQLVGRQGEDGRLLAIGEAVERVLPVVGVAGEWWR
ncbi:MAG: amidase [Acetobacteraceae bacterium]|nr:amidase [Acetobacteraceae bacterium]